MALLKNQDSVVVEKSQLIRTSWLALRKLGLVAVLLTLSILAVGIASGLAQAQSKTDEPTGIGNFKGSPANTNVKRGVSGPRVTTGQAGDIDPSFKSGFGPSGSIRAIGRQSSGKLIVGGLFITYGDKVVQHIARLNLDGTLDTTFNPGGTGTGGTGFDVYAIAVQSDDKILIGGNFGVYNGTVLNSGLTRLNPDGTLDNTFHSGISGGVQVLKILSDGKILVGSGGIARLNSDGTLDTTFNFNGSGITGNSSIVFAIAVQPDGKIVLGGSFTSYNGTTVGNIARLNPDGTRDTTFNPGGSGADSTVSAVTLQTDGKILLGGYLSTYNGTATGNLARLNLDGTLDNTFNPSVFSATSRVTALVVLPGSNKILVGAYTPITNSTFPGTVARLNPDGTLDTTFNSGGSGVNGTVYALLVQGDGKILVGGFFTGYNGIGIERMIKLNPDGTPDPTFGIHGAGASAGINALALQSDGKIVIGGQLNYYNGISAGRVTRLNADGTLDTTFNPGGAGANNIVNVLVLQSDGKILVSGVFTTYNSISVNHFIRLNPNGTLDTTFNPGGSGASGPVSTIAVQSDGKILIGGAFGSYNGTSVSNLARLNADGTLDTTFNPGGAGTNGGVSALIVQGNGNILIGGSFTNYNGTTVNNITRLNPDGTLDPTFSPNGTGNKSVGTIAVQADGRILAAVNFLGTSGLTGYVVRLNADGTMDNSFNTNNTSNPVSGYVKSLLVLQAGKILIGGSFYGLNGTSASLIARLNPDGSVDTTFNPGGIGSNSEVDALALQGDGKILAGGFFTSFNTYTRDYVMRLYGVNETVSTVTVTSSLNPALLGSSITFTASIQPITATGSVVFNFNSGGNTSAVTTTVANGVATYVTSTLPAGNTLVTASYSGDSAVTSGDSSVYTQVITVPCDPSQVTSNLDDGSCGTLRAALAFASTSQTKTVTINLTAGSVISLTTGLTLTNGVVVTTTASCGTGPNNTMLPPVTLQGVGASSGNGLTLAGHNQLYGLWVRGFSGVQIKAPVGSYTKMQCVRASKN